MKRQIKSRRGFTLVEMLLSLAIICMIGGVIGGLCVSIANSFATTYNIDDSADYAMLYAKGFENSFLATTQGNGAKDDYWTWSISNSKGVGGPPLLQISKNGGTPSNVFTPRFIGTTSSPSKWSVIMFYATEQKNTGSNKSLLVKYRIYMRDNYSRTSYIYRYDGSFWIPRFFERANMAGPDATGRAITVDTGSSPMTEETLKAFCMDGTTLNQKAFDAIKDDLEENTSTSPAKYWTTIKYKWG